MHQDTCRTCQELLLEFKFNEKKDESSKIKFELGDDRDIYNITSPFMFCGEVVIVGRVEARDSENSEVIFFVKENDVWRKKELESKINLQDPFFTFIDEELILGGVQIYDDPLKPGTLAYRTIFMRGTNFENLKVFAKGPERMKDIRLLQMDDRILVFTRPQGELGGRGTIGYTFITKLEELTPEKISSAKLLKNQFVEEEWGGANQLHLLKNKKVGVLSHIASFDEDGNRHYYSTTFCFDPQSGEYSPMKLIAIRNNFADGPAKRPDLSDVIFSGGLVRKENKKAELYCGVGDAQGHFITIDDPFAEYEM